MILDSGVCTIYRRRDVSARGEKPRFARERLLEGWYGELEFETNPSRPTENREEVRVDTRIRVLDDRRIRAGCEVILTSAASAVAGETVRYEVTRAYHGTDEESGESIADLSMREVGAWN